MVKKIIKKFAIYIGIGASVLSIVDNIVNYLNED